MCLADIRQLKAAIFKTWVLKDEDEVRAILTHLKQAADVSCETVEGNVFDCRTKRTFKSAARKMEIVVSPTFLVTLNKMATAWMRLHKKAGLTGVDARGGLEDEISKLLEQMK
eukprot:TRINITY_DN9841_c0_g2_i2.p2 TRINITY_DN9841_c0_g2~~TRINITY_DN9841_c0_g2_i2.p2  ORF type:complete len:113 (+),score=22.04 TRINITY_DN9841_c0_g2_i2:430-768(+)